MYSYPSGATSFSYQYDADGNRLTQLGSGLDTYYRLNLRPKAASDLESMAQARKLLGHTTENMTAHYVRKRVGELVKPVK